MSAGEAGRYVVAFLDCFIGVFLEVQNQRYSYSVSNRLYCVWGFIYGRKYKYSGKAAENLFPNILA